MDDPDMLDNPDVDRRNGQINVRTLFGQSVENPASSTPRSQTWHGLQRHVSLGGMSMGTVCSTSCSLHKHKGPTDN